jgi:hypothetical protein
MNNSYLESTKKQFEYYKLLGDKTIEQVPEEKLFWQYNDESNSIAIIVKHLSGNMLSRWTDFLTTDGEKEWRHRDAEFENDITTKSELIQKWNAGWNCLFEALHSLQEEDFSKTIYIRNQGHSVTEAINRQLAHYPYHVGQMVFIGKMLCNEKWISLSIPKGNSKKYNAEKFVQPKHNEHFTEEFLHKNQNMKKENIIHQLNSTHASFWETVRHVSNTSISIDGKWSVDQHTDHLNKILLQINNFMNIPKAAIKQNFGLSNRKSIPFESFIKDYQKALEKGVKSTAPYIPDSNLNAIALIAQGNVLLSDLI